MPDAGLLLALAEIAGIFVGFGALISIRSTDPADDGLVVSTLRYVTWVGVWVLISSLAPVALSRVGLTGRALWLPSALSLGIFIALWLTDAFSPESKAFEKITSKPLRRLRTLYLGVGGPLVVGLLASLVVVALGVWTDADQGLYFAAVTLGMALAAFTLLTVVFMAPHR